MSDPFGDMYPFLGRNPLEGAIKVSRMAAEAAEAAEAEDSGRQFDMRDTIESFEVPPPTDEMREEHRVLYVQMLEGETARVSRIARARRAISDYFDKQRLS